MSVDAASESSERRTRRNWHSWKKPSTDDRWVLFQTQVWRECQAEEACRTRSINNFSTEHQPRSAVGESTEAVSSSGPQPFCLFGLILDSLLTSNDQCFVCRVPIHPSTLSCCEIRSGYRAACRLRKYNYNITPCLAAKSARSAVYNKNNSEPKTDPCGTEHVTCLMKDEASA